MNSENERKSKLVKRYTRWAILSGFLLALLWPLGSFFFWVFFGATSYFIFLVFFYSPRVEREDVKFEFKQRSRQPFGKTASIPVSPKNIKLIIGISMISLFGFLLIVMIIGFATGRKEKITIDNNRELLLEDPDNIDALINIGNTFYSSGQYDSAIAHYESVLKTDPTNSSALYNKGLTLYQTKNYNKSIEFLRKCVSLYPDNTDAMLVLGDNYYSQENYYEAIVWYKQAYDKGVRTSGLFNVMAYIYDVQNQKTKAIQFYKQALEQDSSLVEVYRRLAELEPNYSDWYSKKAEAWR